MHFNNTLHWKAIFKTQPRHRLLFISFENLDPSWMVFLTNGSTIQKSIKNWTVSGVREGKKYIDWDSLCLNETLNNQVLPLGSAPRRSSTLTPLIGSIYIAIYLNLVRAIDPDNTDSFYLRALRWECLCQDIVSHC